MTKLSSYTLCLAVLLISFGSTPLFAGETLLESPAFKSGKVTLVFSESPLKTMTETPFSINILGDSGDTISDAELSIDMDMPAMPMPPNKPEAQWRDGAYRGNAIFTMAGAWQVTVSIQRPGEVQEQLIFNIDQVMMK